jgi:Matrixin/Chitinase A, N-terminal domain
MKTRYQWLCILLLLTAAGTIASAYVLNGPKWGSQQVPYYINPTNKYMSETDALTAIQNGASAWTAQSSADIVLSYVGRTTGNTIAANGKNEVFFRDASNGGMYGETYWWSSGGTLVEADTVFYTGTVQFFADTATCTGTSYAIYLQDAAAHELGHALGLGHSSVSSATMYPSLGLCSTSGRTLDADDLAGIESLYPGGTTPTNTAPVVSISAPASGSSSLEGTAVSFAGSASDKEDGNISSGLVWTSSINGQIGTGASFTQSVSAGSHTITATATDRNGVSSWKQIFLTVTSPAATTPSSITLSARGRKVKGLQRVDLSWVGADSTTVAIIRDGVQVLTTPNDGRETDPLNTKGGGSYTYKVCASGTSTCSPSVTVSF